MLEIFFKTIRDQEFKKIKDFRAGCWVNVTNPTSTDIEQVLELTNLDFLDLKDSLDIHEVPRIEVEGDTVIIFSRHPSSEEIGLYTTTLTLILTPTMLISISPQNSHVTTNVVKSILQLGTTQKSKLLLHILLKITQDFTNKIKQVRYKVITQEKEIQNIHNEAIVALTKNEETLNQYLTSLVPMRNLLEAIAKGRLVHLYEEDKDLVEDCMIAIKQSEDVCRVNVKSIRSLRDSYQILFTNDVNKTIKRLTAITIIFTIPTIISSIYGMNVSLPLEKNPYAFLIIMNITVIFSLVSVLVFLKKRWL